MKTILKKILSFKNSTGNSVNESISITDPIKIDEVGNQIIGLYSDAAVCIALNDHLQPVYISTLNKIVHCYYEYKTYYNNPQFQSLIDNEDTWQSKTSFIVIVDCECDTICYDVKEALLDVCKPEYNQKAYLKHTHNCDLINLRLETKLVNYPNGYTNYIIVPKSFPLWKLKVEIVQFFGNRTFSGPGLYYWVTATNKCHLKTLHVKKGDIIHAKDTSTHQYNYFMNEQDAINLLALIKQFLATH